MPLYEYVCRACHADFEALAPASRRDAPDVPCPRCAGAKVARKVSLAAPSIVKEKSGFASAPIDCGAAGGCCGGGCNYEA